MLVLCKCSISFVVFLIWWNVDRTSGQSSIQDQTSAALLEPRPSEGNSSTSDDAFINITAVLPRTSVAASSRAADENPRTSVAASSRAADENPRTSVAVSSRAADESPRTSVAASSRAADENPRTSVAASSRAADENSRTSLETPVASVFDSHDYILTEIVRLVFKGNVATAGFPDTIYGLTESFLTRATRELKAEDGSNWSYELTSTLQPISCENITTYIDFRIKHTAQKAIFTVFDRLGFGRFISQNSNLVLIGQCWPHKNCQNGSVTTHFQQTELEPSFNLFTTLVVLCSLCLVIVISGVVCLCLKRMNSSKTDTDFETKDFAETSQRILVKPNSISESPARPSPAAQTTSFYASAADEDEDVETLHNTWIVPLDEAPGREPAVLVVTTQDTKL